MVEVSAVRLEAPEGSQLSGGEFRFLSPAAAKRKPLIRNTEWRSRHSANMLYQFPHTHMTAAVMITAAIAAANRHSPFPVLRGMPACAIATSRFTRCSSNFWPNDSFFGNRVNFRSIRRTGGQ